MIKVIVDNAFNYTDGTGRTWEYYKTNFGEVLKTFYSKNAIKESNLSRLNTHINNGCFMISACRGDKDEKTNKANTEKLAKDLRSEGLGFIRVLGGYVENKDTADERTVTEESFFVPQPKNFENDVFFDVAIRLCKKYNQDSVLISMPGFIEFGYYDKNGDFDFSPGTKLSFTEENVAEYFSELVKGSKANVRWSFTTEWLALRHPVSVPQSALMKQNGENLHLV